MRKFGRKAKRNTGRLRHNERLKLTSMMDILVVLLLFLLKSFVVEGEVITPTPGLDLPHSTSKAPPEEAIVVAVLEDAILIGSELVASIEDVVGSEHGLLIQPLAVKLGAVRAQVENIARMKGEDPPERYRATIQGDKDLEFQVLESVMFTLSRSGYEEISLAVVKNS